MKRVQRLEVVQRVVDDAERRRAEALALSERRVSECEAKLAELESYRRSYAQAFTERAARGMGAVELLDYQTFIARLDEAVRQQTQIVERARADRNLQRASWQSAAQRAQAVGKVVKRRQADVQRAIERRDQHESDERAQRISTRGHYFGDS